jgi:hypothetical protein
MNNLFSDILLGEAMDWKKPLRAFKQFDGICCKQTVHLLFFKLGLLSDYKDAPLSPRRMCHGRTVVSHAADIPFLHRAILMLLYSET